MKFFSTLFAIVFVSLAVGMTNAAVVSRGRGRHCPQSRVIVLHPRPLGYNRKYNPSYMCSNWDNETSKCIEMKEYSTKDSSNQAKIRASSNLRVKNSTISRAGEGVDLSRSLEWSGSREPEYLSP
ncbi:hypothetical protein K435DRAFT_845907 [Dendrothele bispora CBS 962.96]|uniref:Uncharacterized protein n=1 Tax=Dendrothele bispora (strain CBS 962.96) TaxID=1314807 RepID=A0A4S8KQY6_DENBC|nr:hypothetical protein K435DRAFT_845907 [Dendrothele bispora CBS 962.96]